MLSASAAAAETTAPLRAGREQRVTDPKPYALGIFQSKAGMNSLKEEFLCVGLRVGIL